jgi:hypothetical protein
VVEVYSRTRAAIVTLIVTVSRTTATAFDIDIHTLTGHTTLFRADTRIEHGVVRQRFYRPSASR